jgi:hypothetical protein
MAHEPEYGEGSGASEFHVRMPEGHVRGPREDSLEFHSGGGHHNFQHYAQHCLDGSGSALSESAFKAKFTAWSIEGAGGVVLFPEGPAFKVLERNFTEGAVPVTYRADAAHYTALMLCLSPTVFPSTGSLTPLPHEHFASYRVEVTWEPDGPVDLPLIPQKTIPPTGEIFMWRAKYTNQKVSLKIDIIPSPTARNRVMLGGRLGAIPASTERV